MISGRLEGFSWRDSLNTSAQFRCPLCGDSKKNKNKKRGTLYIRPPGSDGAGEYSFHCHNECGPLPIGIFFERVDPRLSKDYREEIFFEKYGRPRKTKSVDVAEKASATRVPERRIDNYSDHLTPLSGLPNSHIANLYAEKRKLPIDRLYWCEDFSLLAEEHFGHDNMVSESRLCLLLRDQSGKVFGVTGRSLDPKSNRKYITLKCDEAHPKIFGLELINPDLPIIIVEGPIDSLFLPNCIAVVGGTISKHVLTHSLGNDLGNVIIALDNEPRKRDTIKRMNSVISAGLRIVFWGIDQKFKDINEMVLGGFSPEKIYTHILEHAESGIHAELEMMRWKRI